MATSTWTGNLSADWNSADNWNPALVPDNATDVFIGTTGTSPTLTGSTTVNSVTITGGDTLTLASAGTTLTASGGVALNSTGGISGVGTLRAKVTAGAASTITASGGTLTISGGITDSGNALTLTIASNSDTLVLDTNLLQNTSNAAHAVNLNGGMLQLNTSATLTVGTALAIGSGTLILGGSTATLTDAGGVSLAGGTIIGTGFMAAAVTASGFSHITAQSTLEFVNSITDSDNSLTLTVQSSGDLLRLDGATTAKTVSFNAESGVLEINTAGSLTVSSLMSLGSGVVQLDGSAAKLNATVSLVTGTIQGAGVANATVTATGAGFITASGGTLELAQSITDSGNALMLTVTGDGDKLLFDAPAAAHEVNWNGSGGTIEIGANGQLTIATQMAQGRAKVLLDGGTTTLSDPGGISLNFGGMIQGAGKVNASVSGPGTVRASGGTLELTITQGVGPTFQIANGAGNVLQFDSAFDKGDTIAFLGAAGELGLGNDLGFNSLILGMNVGSGGTKTNFVDIEAHTVTIAAVGGQGTTSGAVTLSDGAVLHLENLNSPNWFVHAASDGAGGTDIYLTDKATAAPAPADFDHDRTSDVLWRNNSNGDTGFWAISNDTIAGWRGFGQSPTTFSIVGNGDFNGDGTSDVLWRNPSNGDTGYWTIANNVIAGWTDLGQSPTTYSVVGVADFTGDGTSDILWRNPTTGDTGYWGIANNTIAGWHGLGAAPTTYSVVGVGDFNGDGISDVLWRNPASGDTGYWTIANNQIAGWTDLGQPPTTYNVVGVGDFNGDGIADVLWHNSATGDTGYWTIANNAVSGWVGLGSATTFNVVGVGDFNGDGISDVLWRNPTTGDTGYWAIANNAIAGWHDLGQAPLTYTVENGATSAGAEGNSPSRSTAYGFDDVALPGMPSNVAQGSATGAVANGSTETVTAAAAGLAVPLPNGTTPSLCLPQ